MKVFGLDELGKKYSEKLMVQVEARNKPYEWNWKPNKPEKIKDIAEIVKAEKAAVNYAAISNYSPGVKKQKVALVFANGNLSYSLIQNLEKSGMKYFYLDFVQFIFKGKVEYLISNNQTRAVLRVNDIVLDLKDVSVVIWNPPKYPYPLYEFDMIQHNGDEKRNQYLFRKRWAMVLREMKGAIDKDCVWIPGDMYHGCQDWQQKISELFTFQKFGLNVPKTIFTNSREEVLRFFDEAEGKIFLREFSTPPYSFPPIFIEKEAVEEKFIENSPCVFQEYIEKKYEYRVVTLFDKVWACRIDSQSSKLANYDWRVHDDKYVKWDIVPLPEHITAKLIEVRNSLGLVWSSMDMILSADDEYYILEMNRPGAHYWLDLFVGLDISKEIIQEIAPWVDKIQQLEAV